jgi:hypothetical protein
VDYSYTAVEEEAALAKLTAAAAVYDATSPSAVSLQSFEGAHMPAHVFREQVGHYYTVCIRSIPDR